MSTTLELSVKPRFPAGPALPAVAQTAAFGLRPWRFLASCRRRYGPTFRVRLVDSRPMVVVSEPEDIRRVFSLSAEEFDVGTVNAELLEPILGARSVLTMDGTKHRDERRRLLHALRAERLGTYGELVRAVSLGDLSMWPRGRPFPIHDRMRAITLEVILRAVFGATDDEDLAALRSVLGPFLDSSGSLVVLVSALRRQIGGYSPWARFVRQRAAVHTEIRALISRRRSSAEVEGGLDILSSLLAAGDDDDLLLDELMTLVLAGHDTTATALAWAFDLLLHNPRVLDRLRDELKAGDEKYLDAVIHEVLRLRPVIGETGRVPREPFPTANGHVPAGTVVVPSIYLAHTDHARYPEPLAFRPERFLDDRPDLATWLPFGGGVRRCLGAGFATLELREVLRTVVLHADVRPVSRALERPRRRAVTMMPAHGCPVEVVEIRHSY